MSALGLVDLPATSGTMNPYSVPYTSAMTLSDASPYAFPVVSSPEPEYPTIFSGYSPWDYYGSGFSSSNDPEFHQEWYVNQQEWYSINGVVPQVSYCPTTVSASTSYDCNGLYGYQWSPYPENPFVASTIVTAMPCEDYSPLSPNSEVPMTRGFSGSTGHSDYYPWFESKELQDQEGEEESNSTISSEGQLAFAEQETAGNSKDSSLRFNEGKSTWQISASTIAVEHSHTKSTYLNSEANYNNQMNYLSQLQQSNQSPKPTLGCLTSQTDMPVPRNYISAFGPICPASDSLESYSSSTLYNNFHKFEPKSTTEVVPINVQEYRSGAQIVRETNSDMANMGNRQPDFESISTRNWEPSSLCSRKTKNAILALAATEQARHVLISDMVAFSGSIPTHFNDPEDYPHSKRRKDLLANCSKGGNDDLLITESDGMGSSSAQSDSSSSSSSEFSPSVDILSSDKAPLQTGSYFSTSLSKSSKRFDFKQNSSSQEIVEMGNLHVKPTFLDFSTISSQNILESNVQGAFSGQPLKSAELPEQEFGRHISSLANIPVQRNYFSAFGPICGNFLEPQSTTEVTPTDVVEYKDKVQLVRDKGKAQVVRDVKSDMNNIVNRQSVLVGRSTANEEPSAVCSRKTKNVIVSPPKTERASHVSDSDMISFSWTIPSHCDDPEKYSHSKQRGHFPANCSMGGNHDLLITKSGGLESSSVQNAASPSSNGDFSAVVDILSSDKPTFETASSFSTSQSTKGLSRHGDLGLSKLLHPSLENNARIVPASQLLNDSNNSESHTNVSLCTNAGDASLSVLKSVMDSRKKCHKLVQSMHNISVLLLSGSSSDKLGESDHQVLESVICNLSECLVERMGLSI